MVSKALGLIRILRPVNCVMMGIAVLIGEAMAYRTLYFYPSLLGFVTAFTVTGASMVTNDYWDRSVDAVNAPNRPIVSGLVPINLAKLYSIILISIGLSSAILTSMLCLLLAIASLLVSLFYNYMGKKLGLLGNLMVSACVAIPLIYGGFVYEGAGLGLEGQKELYIFDLMIFLTITGREVNKGMTDVEGDRIRKVRTVAIQFGLKVAAFVTMVFYLSAVALSAFPWFLKLTSWTYIPFIIIADLGFVASSFILLYDYSKESAMKVKNMVLVWMFIGLLAFVAGVFK